MIVSPQHTLDDRRDTLPVLELWLCDQEPHRKAVGRPELAF